MMLLKISNSCKRFITIGFVCGVCSFISMPYALAEKGDTVVVAGEVTEESFVFNFVDVDIETIISAVSKYTKQTFIIDKRVKAKVTIISQYSVSPDEAYRIFLSILQVNGFAAIPGTSATKIVPAAQAKQNSLNTSYGNIRNPSDELVTHIIEVQHVNAQQLTAILRPLIPNSSGHIAAVPSSNVLIITDTKANISRIQRIIRRIDTVSNDEIEVVPLQHATASEVVRILAQLNASDKNAKGVPKMVADDRTNSILISGDKPIRLRLKALILHLDTPLEVGGNTHVIYLRNAVAKDLVPVLTGVSKSVEKGKSPQSSPIIIQADEHTNALVITAPPEVFRSLKQVIVQLDVRRAQVLVEAVIAEVSSNFSREFGVQWGIDGRDSNNAVGLVNFGSNPISAYADLSNPPNPVGFNVGVGDLSGSNKIVALITALSGDATTNILSTPTLVTLDNEEAEIVVGQNVPFVTGSYSSTGSGSTASNPFQTIERQDVGLTLRIKPQINEGDSIKLDVEQEVSSLSASADNASDLITNKRSIKTSVIVSDGEIIVLGGLIEDTLTESEQKVPLLGDIPLLGWLFRYQETKKIKTNLMVFIHPTILKDDVMIRSLTGEKYNYLRAEQQAVREKGLRLVGEDQIPLLPEMDEFLALPPPYEESATRMELSTMPPPVDSQSIDASDSESLSGGDKFGPPDTSLPSLDSESSTSSATEPPLIE